MPNYAGLLTYREIDSVDEEPWATVHIPFGVFLRLTSGRPVSPVDATVVDIEGDPVLGDYVMAHLNVLF